MNSSFRSNSVSEMHSSKPKPMFRNCFRHSLRLPLTILVAVVFVIGLAPSVWGQNNPSTIKNRPGAKKQVPGGRPLTNQDPTKTPPKTSLPEKKEEKLIKPDPENLVLATSDGVKLAVTYFGPPAPEGAQAKAVPFILLHDWEGDRKQLLQYAAFLQASGHAAIVPDLRGHGQSTAVEGLNKTIDAKKFRKNEVASVQKDIERCKKYLVQRNNEGEVNIDMLSVVAVGESSVLAVEWVINDWFAYPPVNADGIKQGQDVKALLLVSPRKKLRGVSLMGNWKHPLYTGAKGAALPLMMIWGTGDVDAAKDSESLYKLLEKSRPDPKEIEDETKREAAQTLYKVPLKGARLPGPEIIGTDSIKGLWGYTNKFIELKVKAHEDSLPWKSRSKEADE